MKKTIIFLIRIYQILPLSSHDTCRFNPTCSHYMIGCIESYGIFNGIKLGLKRLSKCHPKGEFGYDPIPLKEENN